MKSKLKKYRLLARLTQTEVAEAVGVSQPTYQRWESGTNSVPKTKVAKLAKILGITQRQVEGQSEPFDLLNVDASVSDERKYFGEVSIHFASGSPPLLLPITQAERLNLYAALQGEASFIQIESLDNRIVSVCRKAIADVFFLRKPMMIMAPKKIMAHNISAFLLMKDFGKSSSSWRSWISSTRSVGKTKSMKP